MQASTIGRLLLIAGAGGAFWVSAAVASAQTADATTIQGKIMAGYQGWFRTPGDVAGTSTWAHWFNTDTPSQAEEAFDMWPDVSSFPAGEVENVPGFTYPDGKPATLYSAQNANVVLQHFKWMQEEGIDGVWASEFTINFPGGSDASNYTYQKRVLDNMRAAATATGRTWAFFYDTTAADPTTLVSVIENQWKSMVDSGYTSDPRYLHEGGAPVIMLYGFFPGNTTRHPLGDPTYGNALISFFKASGKYHAYLVGSGIWNWTSGDSAFQSMLFSLNAYIPWNLGNTFTASNGNIEASTSTWASDTATFKSHGVKFIPAVYSGGSTAGAPTATETAPRRGGYFLWEQYVAASKIAGINTVFVAMYDEVNEGTAIMPISSTPPKQSPPFFTNAGYPSDWYEKLVVKGGSYLKSGTVAPANIPISPTN